MSKPLAYYNEFDPFAAAWLRTLIAQGHISPGFVDERDIREVRPDDLRGFTRHHFFAGIGGWDHALNLAEWPDEEAVWTGSCPCQPFSGAGRRGGAGDARHLWPEWWRLIADCQPSILFGEQVASRDGRLWLTAVRADLEALGYAVGAADLCAAGVGAPHIRQRVWFVADAEHSERRALHVNRKDGRDGSDDGWAEAHGEPGACGEVRGVADSLLAGRAEGRAGSGSGPVASGGGLGSQALGDSNASGREGFGRRGKGRVAESGAWSDLVWLPCRDGKARPAPPGIFPLASGVRNRVGALRGAGNAIVPQVAEKFIRAYRATR